MADGGLDNKPALGLEVFLNLLVRFLDVDALVIRHFAGEASAFVNRARRRLVPCNDAIGDRDAVILVTEGGSLVYDTGTGIGRHVSVRDDFERARAEL